MFDARTHKQGINAVAWCLPFAQARVGFVSSCVSVFDLGAGSHADNDVSDDGPVLP